MKLVFKLLSRELRHNKGKVTVALIVVLILYMSAFTLCNVAQALPYNFYRYYEEYNPDMISINISDADSKLYYDKDKYFTKVSVDFSGVFDDYFLYSEDLSNKYLPYYENGDYGKIYYNAFIFDDKDEVFTSKNLTLDFISKGSVPSEENKNGVWIDESIATVFGIVDFDVENPPIINFATSEDKYTPIEILGIYDGEKYSEYLYKHFGYNSTKIIMLMYDKTAGEIMFKLGETFSMQGYIGKVDDVFNVYTTLSPSYNLEAKTIFDMVSKVKNSEFICTIIGTFMLLGGLVIMLNFVSILISSNIKNIGLLRILGAKTKHIVLAYYFIFLILITIVCVISWSLLPLYNVFVGMYCTSIGYPFTISIDYLLVMSLFLASYVLITLLMAIKYVKLNAMYPTDIINEED